MSQASVIRGGKIAAAIMAISALIGGAWAITGNDTPPVSGIERVKKLEGDIEAYKTIQQERGRLADQNWYEAYSALAAQALVRMRQNPNDVQAATDYERYNRWARFYAREVDGRSRR